MKKWLLGGFLLFFALVVIFVGWYELESHLSGPEGPRVIVTVTRGEPVDSVVDQLAAQHVLRSATAFRISMLFHGTPATEPGIYEFFQHESFGAVSATLSSPPDVFSVGVYPGFTLRELESEISADVPGPLAGEFTAAVSDGDVPSPFRAGNDEGLLGTGSYRIVPGESGKELLSKMVARFDHDAHTAGIVAQSGLTAYQVITIASIAVKEGYYPKYFGDVARVIDNRLAAGMHLAMTSTVLYALGKDGGTVTPQDEQLSSPYNTYLSPGLPPTPIAFVTTKALAAAAHPPPGTWLYFVTVNKNGTTRFSTTFAQQTANEKLAKANGLG